VTATLQKHADTFPARKRAGRLSIADLACLGTLAACALVLHRDGLIGGTAFYERDTQLFYFPLAQWVAEQLKGGQFPLWLPGIFTGYPIFADGELGLAYLPQVLLLFALPTPEAMVWLRALHAFLAGAFTFWFLRTLRLEPLPALGGALVFAFGSFMTVQMHHENVVRSAVWLPAVLACFQRAIQARVGARVLMWIALGALSLAQSALGLHVQPVLMLALALAGYAVFRAVVGPRRVMPLLAALAVAVGGAGVAAVQWLPLGEWALVSSRRGGVAYEFGSAFAISPENLPTILFPFFFRLPDATTWWTLWQQWETELYVGIPTLALMVVGVLFSRRVELLYFVPLAVVSLLIAMAHYAPLVNLHFLLWSVPGFSFLRAPGRFSYLVVFACACLAAFGLQALFARRARLVVALGGAVPSVALLAALLAILPPWRAWLAADLPRATTYVQSTYLATRAQYPIDPNLAVSGFLYSLDLANPKTLWTLALLAMSALGFVVWLALGVRRAALGQLLLVSLIAVDLLVFASDFHPRAPLSSLASQLPAGVAAGQRALLDGYLPELEPDQLLSANVSTAEGYSSLPSQRHVELYAATQSQPALLDLWGERVIIEPTVAADGHEVNGVRFRAEHPLLSGFGGSEPSVLRVPADVGTVAAVRLVGTLSYAFNMPHGTTVATLDVDGARIPLRAGIELSERAYDRPSLKGLVQHQRAGTAFDFEEATPEGEAYVAHLYQTDLPLAAGLTPRAIAVTPMDPSVLVEIHGVALVSPSGQVRSLGLADRDGLQRLGPNTVANTRALPRAFVLPRAQAFSPGRHPGLTATQLVASPDVDLHRQVLIEGDPDAPTAPGPSAAEAQPARLVDIGPNVVQVIASADVPSYLVVTDFYHRGWNAYVDGRPTRVVIADALYRAVSIEPGQHVVELRFQPLSHALGAVASMFTLLVAVGLLLYGLRVRST